MAVTADRERGLSVDWITTAKRAYAGLPPVLRGPAASVYGRYLRWWRYGPDVERLVAEAVDREDWSADRWSSYHEQRLDNLLQRAATHVPHYRAAWDARRAAGDRSDWHDLRSWPILNKEDLRAAPRAFVADDTHPARLLKVSTSGTSGSPVTMWRTLAASRGWFALFEARTRRWYGVDRHVPWAILGGQLVVPATQSQPPFWVWNAAFRQLYLSTMHLEPRNVRAYLGALEHHGVEYLFGYASSAYWLARLTLEAGLEAPQLRVVISNAEPLSPMQRRIIGEAFRCPVRDTYGMVESVAGGSECDMGVMHLWPEVGLVEVLGDDDLPVPPGAVGRFVCTGLLNDAMPLIRYEVGDRGSLLPPTEVPHACGRRLPVVGSIEGRSSDNLVTPEGRRIFWINPIFYDVPVREAQVIQEAVDDVRVLVVPDTGFVTRHEGEIARRLVDRLGPSVGIRVERVASIPRGPNGKFRAVVSRVRA